MRVYPRYHALKWDTSGFVTVEFRDYSPTAPAPHLHVVLDPVDAQVLQHDLAESDPLPHYDFNPDDDPREWKQHQPPKTKYTAGPSYEDPQL